MQNSCGDGVVYLDYVTWNDAPCVDLGPPLFAGAAWKQAWVCAATQHEFGTGASTLRVCQTEGTGLLIQGTRNWRDYVVIANVTPRMARSAGIAIRVQGLRRYYALLLCQDNKLRLIKYDFGAKLLAEAEFEWTFGQTVELSLAAEGKHLKARANGKQIFELDDAIQPIDGGAFALVVEEGCVESGPVTISPVE